MENGMVGYEKNIKQRKQNLFSLIPPGSVIADVGIGTGPNLSLMPPNSTIIGIEPNPYMWPYVKDKAREYNNLASLKLLDATCENMPLVDTASCDAAITTLTLCSIPDVIGGLHEIKRVLKPGGVFLFVEHVIAEPTRPVLRFAQKVLTPVQKALADGCHLDRDSESLIVAAMGDSAEEIQIERFDAVFGSAIENAISPLRPHISGFVRLKKGV